MNEYSLVCLVTEHFVFTFYWRDCENRKRINHLPLRLLWFMSPPLFAHPYVNISHTRRSKKGWWINNKNLGRQDSSIWHKNFLETRATNRWETNQWYFLVGSDWIGQLFVFDIFNHTVGNFLINDDLNRPCLNSSLPPSKWRRQLEFHRITPQRNWMRNGSSFSYWTRRRKYHTKPTDRKTKGSNKVVRVSCATTSSFAHSNFLKVLTSWSG